MMWAGENGKNHPATLCCWNIGIIEESISARYGPEIRRKILSKFGRYASLGWISKCHHESIRSNWCSANCVIFEVLVSFQRRETSSRFDSLGKILRIPPNWGGMLWPSKGCNATAYKIQSQKRFEVKHQQISQFIAIPTRMNEAKSRDLTIKFIYSSFCYDKSRWLIYHVWAILHQSEQCFTAIYDDKQYYSDSFPLQNSIKTLISTAHDLHISSNSSTRSSSPSFRQNSPRIR